MSELAERGKVLAAAMTSVSATDVSFNPVMLFERDGHGVAVMLAVANKAQCRAAIQTIAAQFSLDAYGLVVAARAAAIPPEDIGLYDSGELKVKDAPGVVDIVAVAICERYGPGEYWQAEVSYGGAGPALGKWEPGQGEPGRNRYHIWREA